MPTKNTIVAAIVLALALAACSSHPITPDEKYRPSGMVAVFSTADWQTVLTRVVTPAGYVRWAQFDDAKSAALPALTRFMALLAVASPDNRPDLFEIPSDRTTYWVNAYNAACIYGVVCRHQAAPYAAPDATLYEKDQFVFGKRLLTLRAIETTKLSVTTDPRLLFALDRCTKSSPPLRDEPFQSSRINFQLGDQAIHCLSDNRFVVIDKQTARLNQLLILDHRQEFIDDFQKLAGHAGSLLDALQLLGGKHVSFANVNRFESLPYDGGLNTPQ